MGSGQARAATEFAVALGWTSDGNAIVAHTGSSPCGQQRARGVYVVDPVNGAAQRIIALRPGDVAYRWNQP